MSRIKPLFIFSLPRSGSTLLQRMIASHPAVATTAEPWLLLPQFFCRRFTGAFAMYGHRAAATAMEDFVATLPEGDKTYYEAVRRFALELYAQSAGPEAEWFLDKTPRYNLIAREILETFPEARAVFLFRDPLAVLGSLCSAFGHGKWRFQYYRADLYPGLEGLLEAMPLAPERSMVLRFEDLLADPRAAMGRVCELLGLEPVEEMWSGFAKVNLKGRMGDKEGEGRTDLVKSPLERWRALLKSPLRKGYGRHYLRWVGPERLAAMGYDQAELLAKLDSRRAGWSTTHSDLARLVQGMLNASLDLGLHRMKRRERRTTGRYYHHT